MPKFISEIYGGACAVERLSTKDPSSYTKVDRFFIDTFLPHYAVFCAFERAIRIAQGREDVGISDNFPFITIRVHNNGKIDDTVGHTKITDVVKYISNTCSFNKSIYSTQPLVLVPRRDGWVLYANLSMICDDTTVTRGV